MQRRTFVHAAIAAAPLAVAPLAAFPSRAGAGERAGSAPGHANAPPDRAVVVRAGEDRFGENILLGGADAVDCRVSATDTQGAFSVFWSETVGKRGPSLHKHPDQDEWFFVQEGSFVFRVGEEDFRLGAGDSVLAPRGVPHTWANVGEGPGRMVITFQPAGLMESFFREVARLTPQTRLSQEQAQTLFRSHGMETLGPPLVVE